MLTFFKIFTLVLLSTTSLLFFLICYVSVIENEKWFNRLLNVFFVSLILFLLGVVGIVVVSC